MNGKYFYHLILKALILIVTTSAIIFSQVPNGGFENWTNGNPDNWSTTNNAQFSNITQTTDAHSGTYAVKGEVVSFSGFSITPALLDKFAYTGRPSSLTGYYKFTSAGSDTLVIIVVTYKGGNGIGAGTFRTTVSAGTYTQFTAPLVYDSQDNPDSASISISILPMVGSHSGSLYYLDDITFSNATAVNENLVQTPSSFDLQQNYPNPFNPSTVIEYQIPEQSHVVLNVYNVLGSKVAELVNEQKPAGSYSIHFNAVNLPSGIYFCAMRAGNFYKINKMTLLK